MSHFLPLSALTAGRDAAVVKLSGAGTGAQCFNDGAPPGHALD